MLMQTFDTFIGLVSVFLILSLIVSAIGEGISSTLNFKGRTLKQSITKLLDPTTAQALFEHEAVKRLQTDRLFRPRLPSYLPDKLIADVIVDLVVNPPGKDGKQPADKKPITPNTVNRAVADSQAVFAGALRQRWGQAECDVERFKGLIADWFNLTGDRSVGWFRRKLAISLFLVGFVVAIFLNADTLYMFDTLSNNSDLRESYVELATGIVDEAKKAEIPCEDDACTALVQSFVDGSDVTDADDQALLAGLCGQADGFEPDTCRAHLKSRLDETTQACRALGVEGECDLTSLIGTALPEATPLLGFDLLKEQFAALPKKCGEQQDQACTEVLGWNIHEWQLFGLKLFGWLITAAAVSLGAPFWFDLLQKIVQIRRSVRPAESAPATAPSGKAAEPATGAAPAARTVIRAAATESADLDDLGKFDTKTYGYSPLNLLWSARLAKLAYTPDRELIAAALEEWGAEGELIDFKHSQCIVARTPRAAFLSFRGTESNVSDWITDIKVSHKAPAWKSDAGYQVHSGFDEALDVIWKDDDTQSFKGIVSTLDKLRVFEQKVPIWLSGHSLGGALATLGALRLAHHLADKGHENIVGGVHTFGQPRVGDSGCAVAIEKSFPARYFRSINNRDIVPRVPFPNTPDIVKRLKEAGSTLKLLDYAHAGRVIYFSDTGKAMMDPPIWYRKLDTLVVGTSLDEVKTAAKETAGDHSMDNYVALHRRMLKVVEDDEPT